jgi:prolyl-tRNA synthetase
MTGVPVRLEIGPKDIENNQAVLVRRDTREKTVVALDELETKIPELLEEIQSALLLKARLHRDEKTYTAKNLEELVEIAQNKPGFIKAMWCGELACEEKIKEVAGTSSRCIPFEQETISDTCVCCGKKANKLVYWGKAY